MFLTFTNFSFLQPIFETQHKRSKCLCVRELPVGIGAVEVLLHQYFLLFYRFRLKSTKFQMHLPPHLHPSAFQSLSASFSPSFSLLCLLLPPLSLMLLIATTSCFCVRTVLSSQVAAGAGVPLFIDV